VTDHAPLSPGGILHLAGALVAGALWLFTRRGRLSPGALHALDVGATLSIIVLFAASGGLVAEPIVGGFVALLSLNMSTLTRAIVVPSTARRTLAIGVAAGSVVVGLVAWRAPRRRSARPSGWCLPREAARGPPTGRPRAARPTPGLERGAAVDSG
jgi:hypothetical protein